MSMEGIIIINKGGNDLQLQIQSNHLREAFKNKNDETYGIFLMLVEGS